MNDYHSDVKSLLQRAEKAEKTTGNIMDRLEAALFWNTTLIEIVGSRYSAFDQILLGLFQDFSRDLSTLLTGDWHMLCRTFSRFYSD